MIEELRTRVPKNQTQAYRRIHHIVDIDGNGNKSTLANKYLVENPLTTLYLNTCGSIKDIGHQILNWKSGDKRRDLQMLIVDIPRTFEDRDSIITMLEMVKSGNLTDMKYEGGKYLFNPPQIMVFANFEPKLEKLSLDRWRVYDLHNGDVLIERQKEIKSEDDPLEHGIEKKELSVKITKDVVKQMEEGKVEYPNKNKNKKSEKIIIKGKKSKITEFISDDEEEMPKPKRNNLQA